MKYVRYAKDTVMKDTLPDEYICEFVDDALFTQDHISVGKWTLLSEEEFKKRFELNPALLKQFHDLRAQREAIALKNQSEESEARMAEEAKARQEYEEFLAWKRANQK